MSLRTFNTHGLLKLPVELLQEICRELQDRDDDDDDYSDMHGDFDDDNPEHIKDLARLALTSRTLYLAANPILWESLPGLEPLLDLMPPEAWDGTLLAVFFVLSDALTIATESAIKARYDTPKVRLDTCCTSLYTVTDAVQRTQPPRLVLCRIFGRLSASSPTLSNVSAFSPFLPDCRP